MSDVNKYEMKIFKEIDGHTRMILIDAYDVLNATNNSAEVDHTVKKLLAMGKRSGGKSKIQDISECIIQLEKERTRLKLLEAPDA